MIEDKGNKTNALSGCGSCIGVAVAVASRMMRAVLRSVAVALVQKQQSTNKREKR